jgi:hypothetical protein
VTASNNDGVWNEQGAALDLVIAPAWYQTNSFLLLCVVTTVVGMYALYQLRMRQVARSLTARFDERLAERTRMARDLHDTLLQTVQGSKMVADNALSRPEDADGMRRAMEQVSSWLGQASTEGRAAVIALIVRSKTVAGRVPCRRRSRCPATPERCIRSFAMRSTGSRMRRFATPARTPLPAVWKSHSPTHTT